MEIHLKHISKRYGRSWIFRDVNQAFEAGRPAAITGDNGAGKSTLLKIISGGLMPTDGSMVCLTKEGKEVHWSDMALLTSYAAPYVELLERLTLREHIEFHYSFRKPVETADANAILEKLELESHAGKQVRDFSSGMKQRLKLALAFYSASPILLLDEPTSNLDEKWSSWYHKEVREQSKTRLVVIASNQPAEYAFCDQVLHLNSEG